MNNWRPIVIWHKLYKLNTSTTVRKLTNLANEKEVISPLQKVYQSIKCEHIFLLDEVIKATKLQPYAYWLDIKNVFGNKETSNILQLLQFFNTPYGPYLIEIVANTFKNSSCILEATEKKCVFLWQRVSIKDASLGLLFNITMEVLVRGIKTSKINGYKSKSDEKGKLIQVFAYSDHLYHQQRPQPDEWTTAELWQVYRRGRYEFQSQNM